MVGNDSTILEKRYPDTVPGTTSYQNAQKADKQITTSGEVEIIDGMIISQAGNVFQSKNHQHNRRPVSALPARQGNATKNQMYKQNTGKTIFEDHKGGSIQVRIC